MGLTTTISTPGAAPAWPAVAKRLAGRGVAVQMRLIDGQPAFPDEAPPEGWRELRVASGGRMVTIRRTTGGIELVTWGNADEAGLALRDSLAAAFAAGEQEP